MTNHQSFHSLPGRYCRRWGMAIMRQSVVFCKQAHFRGNSGDFMNYAVLRWAAWAHLVLLKNNVPSKCWICPYSNRQGP